MCSKKANVPLEAVDAQVSFSKGLVSPPRSPWDSEGTESTLYVFSDADTGEDSQSHFTLRNGIRAFAVCSILFFVWLVLRHDSMSWRTLFFYHPLFMMIGFVGVLPELAHTIAVFLGRAQSHQSFGDVLNMHRKYALLLKVVCALGIVVIEWNKFSKYKRHFKSWHGIIGGVCEFTMILETIIGLSMYYNVANRYLNGPQLTKLVRIHRYLGFVMMLTGTISMSLGMFTHFATKVCGSLPVQLVFAIIPFIVSLCPFFGL
ncbi:hypothetical protein TRVL_07794 [Trypanosoma vivax]|nr:hypothetical protein TRVL_07794 [Trypanosoma vivax]